MKNPADKNTKSWSSIKDEVFGEKGTERRDSLEREFTSFQIGLLVSEARKRKNLSQKQLAELIQKKREYISQVENNKRNITLQTLYDIVEKGLGGKVIIKIDV
jgi:ribosome-binding protein aMBF1 (putative translation factor)